MCYAAVACCWAQPDIKTVARNACKCRTWLLCRIVHAAVAEVTDYSCRCTQSGRVVAAVPHRLFVSWLKDTECQPACAQRVHLLPPCWCVVMRCVDKWCVRVRGCPVCCLTACDCSNRTSGVCAGWMAGGRYVPLWERPERSTTLTINDLRSSLYICGTRTCSGCV